MVLYNVNFKTTKLLKLFIRISVLKLNYIDTVYYTQKYDKTAFQTLFFLNRLAISSLTLLLLSTVLIHIVFFKRKNRYCIVKLSQHINHNF